MDYANYLQSMITYSKNLRTSNIRNNNRFERGGRGGGGGGRRGGNDGENEEKKWKKDMTAFVPYKDFIKMSATEKLKIEAAKKVAK